MKHWRIFLFLLFPFQAFAQGSVVMEKKDFVADRTQDPQILRFLSDFPSLDKLDMSERDHYYWVNLLRKDPQGFSKNYVVPFSEQFPELAGTNLRSLKKELGVQQPLGLVAPAGHLQQEAERHAVDMAKKQRRLSHQSSDGRSFSRRMADAGVRNCAGENVFEGDADALVAIILLLIDEGVPNLGHRKALLNPAFDLMGVAVEKSSDSSHYLVQLFSCR